MATIAPATEAQDPELVTALCAALSRSALPGESDGFDPGACREAAGFVAAAAAVRAPLGAIVYLESAGGAAGGQRRMRLVLVNDDMPFLVDSVAAAISARGLTIHRLLHPVVTARRDADGRLLALEGEALESIIYVELDRADARERRELVAELEAVLADVRAAVADWPEMKTRLEADAARLGQSDLGQSDLGQSDLGQSEHADLLRWFSDHKLTLLGSARVAADGSVHDAIGILGANARFPSGGAPLSAALGDGRIPSDLPVIGKADRTSTVHRRVPLDLVIVPTGDGILSVHAALWTSAALREPPETVPVLRERLLGMEAKFGFSPHGHAAKALRHAVASLPHDLLVALDADSVETVSLTAMSLADRPRPTLLLLPGALGLKLFAFVWLPRDDMSTARRLAIGTMLQDAAHASLISNWSVELGDGELALLRFTLDVPSGTPVPDAAALDRRLDDMVRGWAPGVEAELVEAVGSSRATRLSLTYVNAFPESYRVRSTARDGATDILRLCNLEGGSDRGARLYRGQDGPCELRLKAYRSSGLIALSDAVPVLENFGFRVLEEVATEIGDGRLGHISEFLLEVPDATDVTALLSRASVVEEAIAAVLEGTAENDEFNMLIMLSGLEPAAALLFRAWFRYLRQTGLSYGLLTVVDALRRAPAVTGALVSLFEARHRDRTDGNAEERAIEAALASVKAIDDDRILRLFRSVVLATLRTNAFVPAGAEALAFKLDSAGIPGLPAPVPWREIWVYSPRIEGIHLRSGPVARGGLRWSDRRDDFRTEILGLMKAQVVKNAVIVPTGAKGGFYPKQLPPIANRDAWLAEGTETYRIFIRSLLSVTDNIANDAVVHPEGVTVHDGDDPYFVVAADKGTASFSDVANAIALERGFWLGDAFASGGSHGYDHKAMAITAKGAWISVQRHFAEIGIDVQTQPIRMVGCGDMSGDVFGNGLLLSKAVKLVAAFDHRHIFIDPEPNSAASFAERRRLFDLPRSSWDDYDRTLLSAGAGIFPRSQKEIALSPEAKAALGVEGDSIDPATLISQILKAQVDLIWFGGIGTYVKASDQNHVEVGDPANDGLRVDATDVRATAIGEGANLAITMAARIEFASRGGRINTDFIDNSAGVDCSDNEVNIKIALNAEMTAGRLSFDDRNALLASMTDEVAELVLDDNRLQTLALSVAERAGVAGLPSLMRAAELLEAEGSLDREVEGLAANDELQRRAGEGRGLTRPELAVLLSTAKMALQKAIEAGDLSSDPTLDDELLAAFPNALQAAHRDALLRHRLRRQIVATKIANRFVNRLGITTPLDLTEEEGTTLEHAATAFVAAERLLDLRSIWDEIDGLGIAEAARLDLYAHVAQGARLHVSDLVRAVPQGLSIGDIVGLLEPGFERLSAATEKLLRAEARAQATGHRQRLNALGAPHALVERIVRLFELDGVIGIAGLAQTNGSDEIALAESYTRLGETLGLDWAQSAAARFAPADGWERLLTAGLARDFEQLRLDFLAGVAPANPGGDIDRWATSKAPRIDQFRRLVDRARTAPIPTSAMLAQIASQARALLAR